MSKNYIPNIVEDKRIKLQFDTNNNNTLFPILNNQIWDFYKKCEALHWVTAEVDFGKDKTHYYSLEPNEQYFIKKILCFFSNVDGIVAKSCDINLADIFENIKELVILYHFQTRIEDVHNETYSILIDTIITDKQEKTNILNGHMVFEDIKDKVIWIVSNIDPKKHNISYLVLSQAIVEGVLFSGSFCAIYWFKSKNKMPGLTISNEFISRDESLHTQTGVMVYNLLKEKLKEEEVHRLMKEAVDIEKKFITESIPCSMIGMNDKLMCQYIEFVADRLLVQLNYSKIYNSTNPFDFMEQISIRGKTNFFENRVSEYEKTVQTEEDKNLNNAFDNMDF